MNIQTVADNLRNTIAGKERLLTKRQIELHSATDYIERMSSFAAAKMLEISIDELKKILADVEQCIPAEQPLGEIQ